MTTEHLDQGSILIVEDNPADVDVLLGQLVGAGFAVTVAQDGERALEQSHYKLLDLILMDVRLPGLDGFETCRRLKAEARTREVPVIFLTSLSDLSDRMQGFAVGGVDYITKPFHLEEVLARVRTQLALYKLQQQLAAQNLQLQREVGERERAEAALQRANAELEQRVAARTAKLSAANAHLQAEISEREQAEAALASERNLLRTLIDNLPDYIFVKDRESRFVNANLAVARLTDAATPDDLVGKTDFDFYPPNMAEQYYSDEQALIQSGQPLIDREELVVGQRTSQKRWLSSTKVPLRDGQGQIVGLVGISRDISERKQLEAQLRQSQKMEAIGRLAGGIAHDFNNVLTAILGYADLVLGELDSTAPLRQEILAIQSAGQRAAALTRQLLAFSRQQVLQPELLNLNTLIANLSHMLRRLISEDIELITIPESDLGNVKADPSQLEQVVLNLVVNARDAMPDGGTLTIETANVELDADYARQHVGVKPGRYVLLAISDTGVGMDVPTQALIFEPFFTTKEAGKGTGLGLATVHGIVTQSGGHIWLYSELGHGSTFKIYLPQAEQREMIARAQLSCVASAPHGSETILLVEDDALVRALALGVLRKYGYVVLEASTGTEALEVGQTYRAPIELLITDVVLPGGVRGTQVARELLAQRPHLKVLYMSGYTDNAIVHHGVLDADVAFLQKPFTPETLARKVREVLDTPALGEITTAG